MAARDQVILDSDLIQLALERKRHQQFAHARTVGEWFIRDDTELTAWIDHLREGIEDPTDVARSATRAVKRRILGLDVA